MINFSLIFMMLQRFIELYLKMKITIDIELGYKFSHMIYLKVKKIFIFDSIKIIVECLIDLYITLFIV